MLTQQQLKQYVNRYLWEPELTVLPRWKAMVISALRIGYAVIRDLAEGMLNLRAMSLVYTTILSLVPLLAVSFSVLKGFGVHNQIEPTLLNVLAPLGEKGVEITERIIEFVDNIKAGVLGSLGLGLLIFTVISLIQKIEAAFNYTWRVSQHRSFAQRFSNYLSVLIIGPVLIFSAIGLTATMMSHTLVQEIVAIQPFGWLLEELHRVLPFLLAVAAFTFIYIFIPNTRVHFTSALIGAIVSGILWNTTGWAFASFVAGSAKYTAIYSAFATLIIFFIWVYLSWMILLTGSSIAYYHQHPETLRQQQRQITLSNHGLERLTLLVLRLIGQHHYHKQPPWSLKGLAEYLSLPQYLVGDILERLVTTGFLSRLSEDELSYLPAVPLEETKINEVLQAIRCSDDHCPTVAAVQDDNLIIEHIMGEMDTAIASALADYTLKELALMPASAQE